MSDGWGKWPGRQEAANKYKREVHLRVAYRKITMGMLTPLSDDEIDIEKIKTVASSGDIENEIYANRFLMRIRNTKGFDIELLKAYLTPYMLEDGIVGTSSVHTTYYDSSGYGDIRSNAMYYPEFLDGFKKFISKDDYKKLINECTPINMKLDNVALQLLEKNKLDKVIGYYLSKDFGKVEDSFIKEYEEKFNTKFFENKDFATIVEKKYKTDKYIKNHPELFFNASDELKINISRDTRLYYNPKTFELTDVSKRMYNQLNEIIKKDDNFDFSKINLDFIGHRILNGMATEKELVHIDRGIDFPYNDDRVDMQLFAKAAEKMYAEGKYMYSVKNIGDYISKEFIDERTALELLETKDVAANKDNILRNVVSSKYRHENSKEANLLLNKVLFSLTDKIEVGENNWLSSLSNDYTAALINEFPDRIVFDEKTKKKTIEAFFDDTPKYFTNNKTIANAIVKIYPAFDIKELKEAKVDIEKVAYIAMTKKDEIKNFNQVIKDIAAFLPISRLPDGMLDEVNKTGLKILSPQGLIKHSLKRKEISVDYKPDAIDFNKPFNLEVPYHHSSNSKTTFLNEMLWYKNKEGVLMALNNGADPFVKAGFFRNKFEAMPFNMFFNRELKSENKEFLKEFMGYIAENIDAEHKGSIEKIWKSLGQRLVMENDFKDIKSHTDKILNSRDFEAELFEKALAEEKEIEEQRLAREEQKRKELKQMRDAQIKQIVEGISKSFDKKLTEINEKELISGTAVFLQENKEEISLTLNDQDLTDILSGVKQEKENAIEKEAQEAKRLEQERIREEERYQSTLKGELQSIRNKMQNNGKMSLEEIEALVMEKSENQRLVNDVSNAFAKEFKEEAEKQEKMKDMEKVIAKEFINFFENEQTHGYAYFGAVGRARREGGFDEIARKSMKKMGLKTPNSYEDIKETENLRNVTAKAIELYDEIPVVDYYHDDDLTKEFLREKAGFEKTKAQKLKPFNVNKTPEKPTIKVSKKGQKSANDLSALAALFGGNEGK